MSDWKKRKPKTWINKFFHNIHTKQTHRVIDISFCWVKHEDLKSKKLDYTHYKTFKKHFKLITKGFSYER